MEVNEIMRGLKAPFRPEDIEWKPQSATEKNGQISLLVVPYLDARAIMDRLDQICGPMWKSEFVQMTLNTAKGAKEGFSCRLSIKIGDEWITRVDGAEVSDIESIKGGHSNALKRAAVQWGIGRYLYDLPTFWVPVTQNGKEYVNGEFKIKGKKERIVGKYDAPRLNKEFLPEGYAYSQKNQQRQTPPPAQNQTNTSNQRSQGSEQRPQQQPNSKPSEQATKSPLEHTINLLSYLKVPKEYVPGLFNKVIGEKKTVGQASEQELKEIYRALNPLKVYLEFCTTNGVSENEMLDFAQITTKERLESHLNLILKMDKVICEETIKLIKADRAAAQTA